MLPLWGGKESDRIEKLKEQVFIRSRERDEESPEDRNGTGIAQTAFTFNFYFFHLICFFSLCPRLLLSLSSFSVSPYPSNLVYFVCSVHMA